MRTFTNQLLEPFRQAGLPRLEVRVLCANPDCDNTARYDSGYCAICDLELNGGRGERHVGVWRVSEWKVDEHYDVPVAEEGCVVEPGRETVNISTLCVRTCGDHRRSRVECLRWPDDCQ